VIDVGLERGPSGQRLDGYGVYTLTECIAATSPEDHHNAIAFDCAMLSTSIGGQELIQVLP